MTIRSDHRVGIGTTAPTHSLHVVSRFLGDGVGIVASGTNDPRFGISLDGSEAMSLAVASTGGHWSSSASPGDVILRASDNNIIFSTGGTNYPPDLTVNLNGNIAVNNGVNSGGYKMYVNGTMYATSYACASDLNLKDNVETLDGKSVLESLKNIRGVSFNWKENGESDLGVIAQEVESVFPEVVTTDTEGMKSVDYDKLVAPLIEAIKEQQNQIESFEQRLTELEKK